MLRSRRFYERVAVAVIALRALRQMGQENRASTMARLAAWNKRELQRLERKAQQSGRAVKGTRQMAHARAPKDLAKTNARDLTNTGLPSWTWQRAIMSPQAQPRVAASQPLVSLAVAVTPQGVMPGKPSRGTLAA